MQKYTKTKVVRITETQHKTLQKMKIEIHLLSQSKAIVYEKVKNAYTKDGMYCIFKEDGFVDKYPMVNIFRVRES